MGRLQTAFERDFSRYDYNRQLHVFFVDWNDLDAIVFYFYTCILLQLTPSDRPTAPILKQPATLWCLAKLIWMKREEDIISAYFQSWKCNWFSNRVEPFILRVDGYIINTCHILPSTQLVTTWAITLSFYHGRPLQQQEVQEQVQWLSSKLSSHQPLS